MIECAMYCLRHRLTPSNSNTQLKWETFYTLLNVVTLDLSWSQISLETFQTIEWCRNHKHRQPETILSYCESIVYGWRCLGFYTWKQKLFRTFKHSDIPGSQLLSDIQTFFPYKHFSWKLKWAQKILSQTMYSLRYEPVKLGEIHSAVI